MESIIVGGTFCCGNGKAVTDFEAFDSADGADGFGQVGTEFLENRIAKADRKTIDSTLNNTADGVFLFHAGV